MTNSYRIATIPADGIGPEVIDAGVTVLQVLAEKLQSFSLEFTHLDWSSETFKATGKYIPDGGLEELRKNDAILFGAVGAPGKHHPALHIMLLLKIRESITDNECRRSRPHIPLGSPSRHLPTIPTIRQCASHACPPRHTVTPAQL